MEWSELRSQSRLDYFISGMGGSGSDSYSSSSVEGKFDPHEKIQREESMGYGWLG